MKSKKRLVIHLDGSEVIRKSDKATSSGWGYIALHDDQYVEASGCVINARDARMGGYHEQIAFINAALFIQAHDFDLSLVTIYCDDELFGNAPSILHKDNFRVVKKELLLSRLNHVIATCFEAAALDATMAVLTQCAIVKVKGHCRHVYQERADYLARFRANAAAAPEPDGSALLSFDDWLKKGIVQYTTVDGVQVCDTWYALFVATGSDAAKQVY